MTFASICSLSYWVSQPCCMCLQFTGSSSKLIKKTFETRGGFHYNPNCSNCLFKLRETQSDEMRQRGQNRSKHLFPHGVLVGKSFLSFSLALSSSTDAVGSHTVCPGSCRPWEVSPVPWRPSCACLGNPSLNTRLATPHLSCLLCPGCWAPLTESEQFWRMHRSFTKTACFMWWESNLYIYVLCKRWAVVSMGITFLTKQLVNSCVTFCPSKILAKLVDVHLCTAGTSIYCVCSVRSVPGWNKGGEKVGAVVLGCAWMDLRCWNLLTSLD